MADLGMSATCEGIGCPSGESTGAPVAGFVTRSKAYWPVLGSNVFSGNIWSEPKMDILR